MSIISHLPDSLDEMRHSHFSAEPNPEDHQYSRVNQPQLSRIDNQRQHNMLMKDLYRQQLDQMMRQKEEIKSIERQRGEEERKAYNQRLRLGRQAEKLKELSYRNYYQMLLSNQNSLSKNYVSPFQDREIAKEKLMMRGLEQDRRRNEEWQSQEQRRIQNLKRNYQDGLQEQMQEKQFKRAQESSDRFRTQDEIKKSAMQPTEISKYQRSRKLFEMQKYKEDLDVTSGMRPRATSGAPHNNDFNLQRVDNRHDLLVNPLPFNMQNPYILRQFQRRSEANSTPKRILGN